MKNFTKAMAGTLVAGAMAVSSASPALARDPKNRIDAGEVIAGALIIGGIAAIAAASSKNKRDRYGYRYDRNNRYDRDYSNQRYGNDYRYDRAGYSFRSGNPRSAVSRCVQAAERGASRYSYGRADVTQIRDVKRKRNGYDIKGRIAVNDRSRYGRDTGKFKCKVRYGRIANIKYKGIRGLH